MRDRGGRERVYNLFLDLDAKSQIEFPIVYASEIRSRRPQPDELADDLRALFDMLLTRILAPFAERDG
jgi:predicted membrane GTPase involved in stress response